MNSIIKSFTEPHRAVRISSMVLLLKYILTSLYCIKRHYSFAQKHITGENELNIINNSFTGPRRRVRIS